MGRDNWFIIENSLASFEQAVKVYYQDTEPVSSIAKSAGRSSSSKSNMGWPLNGSDKEKVLKLYENLSESKMWKLFTGKYVEKAMYDMEKNLNYEHPICSVILDMNDKNWEEYFSADELDEINEAANMEKQLLPTDFQTFLDGIPKTTDLRAMFSHLSTQIFYPFQNQALYWLKKSLQDAADMFITRCLPIVRSNLLDDVDRWSSTVNFVAFWQERARTATVVQSRVAYGENIQDNIDQNINVVEQENDGEVLESSSSATMTPFIDNNASSPTLDRTMDNEMPTTPWIIGNTNITDLFQQYRRHVDTIDLPLSS
ncbi:hypothetical protein G6F38_011867 [Rhizopus arrhizus]|nr:hypothetical protein G6F38_011867 [Rhizopus arrhizus]